MLDIILFDYIISRNNLWNDFHAKYSPLDELRDAHISVLNLSQDRAGRLVDLLYRVFFKIKDNKIPLLIRKLLHPLVELRLEYTDNPSYLSLCCFHISSYLKKVNKIESRLDQELMTTNLYKIPEKYIPALNAQIGILGDVSEFFNNVINYLAYGPSHKTITTLNEEYIRLELIKQANDYILQPNSLRYLNQYFLWILNFPNIKDYFNFRPNDIRDLNQYFKGLPHFINFKNCVYYGPTRLLYPKSLNDPYFKTAIKFMNAPTFFKNINDAQSFYDYFNKHLITNHIQEWEILGAFSEHAISDIEKKDPNFFTINLDNPRYRAVLYQIVDKYFRPDSKTIFPNIKRELQKPFPYLIYSDLTLDVFFKFIFHNRFMLEHANNVHPRMSQLINNCKFWLKDMDLVGFVGDFIDAAIQQFVRSSARQSELEAESGVPYLSSDPNNVNMDPFVLSKKY